MEKCEACWIGAAKDNPAKPINCKWINIASEAIRTFCIYISYDKDLAEKLNFLDNLKPFSAVIRAWEMAYQKFIQLLLKPSTSQLYGFGKLEWEKVYMLPRIVTIESTLRSFQYTILNNILYLHERLLKFNILTVHYAHSVELTTSQSKHLFCTCTMSQRLWDQLKS